MSVSAIRRLILTGLLVLIGIALSIGGVPMAMILGILTGLLAFIPNIGAIVSGVLLILVGFSAGTDTGLWAIAIYFIVRPSTAI